MPSQPVAITRHERRRARTRASLLDAARRAIGEKGVDAITVAEIADTADVGFGSFYNHFTSKEAIVEELVGELADVLGDRVDAAIVSIADPARALAAAIRLFLAAATADPIWGRFLVRLAAGRDDVRSTISERARRDIVRGVESGRFRVADIDLAVAALGGATLFVVREAVAGRAPADFDVQHATMALGMLGLGRREALRLAALPLPELTD